MKINCRGQALAQVLVMSMIMIFLASLMLRGAMQQVQMQSHSNFRGGAVKSAEAALNAVIDAWSANQSAGPDCTSGQWTDPVSGDVTKVCCSPGGSCGNNKAGNCTVNGGTPGCTCTLTGPLWPPSNPLTVTATNVGGVGGTCKLAVNDTNIY